MTKSEAIAIASEAYDLAYRLNDDPMTDGQTCRLAFRTARDILRVIYGPDHSDATHDLLMSWGEHSPEAIESAANETV